MLAAEIERIVREEAVRHLSATAIDGVTTQETLDSEGHDAVRITITLKANSAQNLKGDDVLNTLVAIRSELARSGEDRLPIVEYEEAGEDIEPDDSGDAQS